MDTPLCFYKLITWFGEYWALTDALEIFAFVALEDMLVVARGDPLLENRL